MAGPRQAPTHSIASRSPSRPLLQAGWLLVGLEWGLLAAGLAVWVAERTNLAALQAVGMVMSLGVIGLALGISEYRTT
jgi:hypothetical protein